MKVASMTVLHYGLSYLPSALASVRDFVDYSLVSYTPHPSHGSRAPVQCPETEAELRDAAHTASDKVRWTRVDQFWQEGKHRDHALAQCADADVVLVLDADEVWDPAVLDAALKQVVDGSASIWRLRFTTPWRSFGWVVRDDMLPERFRDQRQGRGAQYGCIDQGHGPVWHFGYAVTDKIMRYKWMCHGHKTELREGWFEQKWEPWPPVKDVHPTCVGFWNPEPMDKRVLPEIMRAHPFYDLDRIE